jgi:hypothetical protein
MQIPDARNFLHSLRLNEQAKSKKAEHLIAPQSGLTAPQLSSLCTSFGAVFIT